MKILIVEDDYIIAQNIASTIEDLGHEVIGPVSYYSEALKCIEEDKPDLGILDIQLSGSKSGIDLGHKIQNEYMFPFIFLTAKSHISNLNLIKNTKPFSILTKPFKTEDLYTAIELAVMHFYTQKLSIASQQPVKSEPPTEEPPLDRLFVKQKQEYIQLNMDDILYLKSDRVYIDILTKDGKTHIVRDSLDHFENVLPNHFIRAHRSYIININYVSKIDSHYVFIENKPLSIGRKYRDILFKRLHIG